MHLQNNSGDQDYPKSTVDRAAWSVDRDKVIGDPDYVTLILIISLIIQDPVRAFLISFLQKVSIPTLFTTLNLESINFKFLIILLRRILHYPPIY